jgi:type IV pilus assembly protein PilW
MNGHHFPKRAGRRPGQRGLTLVELLVAITINLAIVIAAVYLYLGTRESQRTIDQTSEANEVGVFALRALGRDVVNAGFYPAVSSEGNENVLAAYSNITAGAMAGYATGIFGCEATNFDLTTGTCGTTAGSDELVVAYFTNDAFGEAGGQRKDCNGNDVGTASVNTSRVGTGAATQPPAKPLFVANHYRLGPATPVVVDGQTSSVRSLECRGNAAGSTAYQQVISNIEDFQVTYGVFSTSDRTVQRFYNATQVAALGTLVIDGKSLTPWARVAAVRICILSQTYGGNSRINDTAGALRTYQLCDGTSQQQPLTDRSTHKTYTQVFGLRNFLNKTY